MHITKFLLIAYIIKESWNKTTKFSNNNIREYFMTLEWNYFLNTACKVGTTKEKITLKLKISFPQRYLKTAKKEATEWEKIVSKYTTNKGLVL